MGLIIKEVKTNTDLRDFVNFPYRLYKNHPYYVPPLKSNEIDTLRANKNPAFEHCESKYWLAFRDDKVVGRIAGILNRAFVSKWKKKNMRFGWFDFDDDETVAKSLLQKVEEWAIDLEMTAVQGPMGFTNFDPAGMLVDGFDFPATSATLYNYPYYPRYVEQAGYQKEVDWIEYKIKIPEKIPEKIAQISNIVRRRNKLQVSNLKNSKDVEINARPIFELLNTSYSNLHGVVPLTPKQVEYYTKRYLPFIPKDYISLVTDQEGSLIAIGITMPCLSEALQKAQGTLFPFGFFHLMKALHKNHIGELCLVAVRPDYQCKGVNALLMEETYNTYQRHGIDIVESNPELEDNTHVQSMWSYFDNECHKRRRCYIKYL